MTSIRPELGVLPSRIQRLPVDQRGYPVPWFVAWENGKPEFRAMDGNKFVRAVKERRCWVCGEQLGKYMAFVVGPMCGINRTSGEPPCHFECADWSARHCPFLSRPHMVRREDDTLNTEMLVQQSGGTALARNPGVTLIWVTRSYRIFNDRRVGKPLITMGDPERVEFFTCGRKATREEVVASVQSGLPSLESVAAMEDGAMAELQKARERFERLYPAAVATA